MQTLRKACLVSATVLALAASAFTAHAQDNGHQYAATKFDPAKMAEHVDKRAQKLHEALKLTAAQEPAWQTYLASLKSELPTMHGDHASMKDLPAPERLEKMIEMSKKHAEKMEAHLAAMKTFYAVLTPEQQKTFDQAVARMHHGQHRMGGMMHRQS
jgi:protein CpxP